MALQVETSNDNLYPCVKHGKHFFAPNLQSASKGGKAISYVKKPLKVSADVYVSMLNSASDSAWAPYIRPTNLGIMKVAEGKAPFVMYEVEGYEEATKNTLIIPPFDVLGRHLPKLVEEVAKSHKDAGLPTSEDDESNPKKRATNQDRIDALNWTPFDCATDKGKGARPCRPNPMVNGWTQLPPEAAKQLTEALKPLYEKAKATQPTKTKAGSKRPAEDTTAEKLKLLPWLEIANEASHVGDMTAQVAVRAYPDEIIRSKIVNGIAYIEKFKKAKAGPSAQPSEEAAEAADEEEEEEEE